MGISSKVKTTTNIYIGRNENPKAIFNTLLATLFASSSPSPIPDMKITKELKVTISVELKKGKE